MSFLDRWLKGRAEKADGGAQRTGGVQGHGHEADPRRGPQREEYRSADPRAVVTKGGAAMSGPAGAPQEGESVEERRDRDL